MEGTILWPLFDDIGELISNQGLASVNTSRNWIHFPIAQYIYIERLTYRIECCMGTNTNFLLQPNDKVCRKSPKEITTSVSDQFRKFFKEERI